MNVKTNYDVNFTFDFEARSLIFLPVFLSIFARPIHLVTLDICLCCPSDALRELIFALRSCKVGIPNEITAIAAS